MITKHACLLSLALICGAPATSATVVNTGFESDAFGTGLTSVSGFTATSGSVDVVGPGFYGIGCASGGKCIDLDGTGNTGPTEITTASYAFGAGDRVTFAFMVSGNQRFGSDEFSFGFNTASNINFLDVVIQNAIGPGFVSIGDLGPNNFLGSGRGDTNQLGAGEPFTAYSISFTASTSSSLTAFLRTSSIDQAGPIIDDVTLDISPPAVPEPATWAMMVGGFGLVGGAMRRRRTAFRFA